VAIAQWRRSRLSIVYSLFSFGGNWNQINFESATAQATGTLPETTQKTPDRLKS